MEYLAPFEDASEEASSGQLIVACVQCKFVKDTTKWEKIEKKMEKAVEKLEGQNVKYFPVV